MHCLLIIGCFTSAFASPLYINANVHQVYKDDTTQNDKHGYTYEKNELIFDHSQGDEQPPIVNKHIYFHVAPQETDYFPPQRVVPPPPPKIHYKIVFIQAPSPPTPNPPVLPPLQPDQEKTLIYVLHKQPEVTPPIVIPALKPTAPTKPEVYFIRYKAQKHPVTTQSSDTFVSSAPDRYLSIKPLKRKHVRSSVVHNSKSVKS